MSSTYDHFPFVRFTVILIAASLCLTFVGGRIEASSTSGSTEPEATFAPDEYDHIIFPTGIYPHDVETVQAAVDLGGRVLMKAVNTDGVLTPWSFGPAALDSGVVILTADVAISGERVDDEMTTIKGGLLPFFKPFGIGRLEPIRLKISGLNFEGPLSRAIQINRSIEVEIIGNRISDIKGVLIQQGDLEFTSGTGISVFGGNDPNAVTGRVVIRDNVFEEITADSSMPIQILAGAARTIIKENVFRRVKGFGINIAFHADQDVDVEANLLTLDAEASDPFPDHVGIAVFGGGDTTYRIVDNVVLTNNPLDRGILVFGFAAPDAISGAVVERNWVAMEEALIALELGGEVHRALVRNNQFRGSGLAAIAVLDAPFLGSPPAIGNTFIGNSVAVFNSAVADVFLDSHSVNTVVTGFGGTLVDLGTNNQVTGLSPIASGFDFGQQLKNALSFRLQLQGQDLEPLVWQ